MWTDKYTKDFSVLEGKTIDSIDFKNHPDTITITADGIEYVMEHVQDCCENVSISDFTGKFQTGKVAKASSEYTRLDDSDGLSAETVFNLTYADGEQFSIKWHGSSNGYYGVGVSFYRKK